MIRILLADDHQVLRDALWMLLDYQPDFTVIAVAGDGPSAVAGVEKHKPDILLVDVMMPGLSGLDVARLVERTAPATRVIVLSMYDSESYVIEAFKAGARGYVLKKSSSEELVSAIRQVAGGNMYLSPLLNERTIRAYVQLSEEARAEDPFQELTQREREIFQLAIEGKSNPQIAKHFSLSVRTVEMHRANLLKKLGIKTQTELIKFAVKKGMA